MREVNFDGLVGATHNYAGLSCGNLASERHEGRASNPRAAALEGLAKMRFVASLGVAQAVLPPQPRPDVASLRRLGFTGKDRDVLAQASAGDGYFLRLASSASSMWTANAATVVPSRDTADARVHFIVANLSAMFHRSLEAPVTTSIFRAIFDDTSHFVVHDPLPPGPYFADEGAANHLRLATPTGAVHVFGWGRAAWANDAAPARYPRRQTREASEATARLATLDDRLALSWQQSPRGIDAGAFHSDVLAVGTGSFLMLHEDAFVDTPVFLEELHKRLGDDFSFALATRAELSSENAVASYPFNSQIVGLPDGTLAVIAPAEARDQPQARAFLDRVVSENNPVSAIHWVDVNASMNNGGGPACLRLRIPLDDEERLAVRGRVFLDDALHRDLARWVERNYRDRLTFDDLRDPALLAEVRTGLDELTTLLELGSVYDFQKP
ncbi:MAG TPA: N-succinylarginine dihydrolase [Polyangiaceae bacterium]|nr:N-succinylarginine dihydrolase [Polyangiaceae bacterium]